MRVTIVHKNQNTLPPHLLSHQWYEVEVCRGKEVSEAKVTLVWLFDNRADIIWKVLARDRLVNIGIHPSVNSRKTKRAVKPGISVCSRIIRLMNNQTKSQRKATASHTKKRRRRQKCSYWENCTTVRLCLARLRVIGFSKRQTRPGNPMQRVLGPIRRVRFTQSTLRPASIRENKGPSLGKITSQNSSSAKSLRNEIWGPVPRGDWQTTAMRPKQGMESC